MPNPAKTGPVTSPKQGGKRKEGILEKEGGREGDMLKGELGKKQSRLADSAAKSEPAENMPKKKRHGQY